MNDLPYNLNVYIKIGMNHSVSETYHLTPWDSRILISQILGKIASCFTHYFQLPYHSILKQTIAQELLISDAICVALYLQEGIYDMAKINRVIFLHRAEPYLFLRKGANTG